MRISLATLFLLAVTLGCGSKVQTVKVHGKVAFTDGSVPKGEVARVHFDPVRADSQRVLKEAAGEIQSDGSYELTTFKSGDGAIPGQYKLFFEVFKTYMGRESLIPARYADPAQTPFTVTVESRNKPMEFKLDKE